MVPKIPRFLRLFAGPFVERAIMASQTSEAVWFNSQDVLPKPAEEEQEDWATRNCCCTYSL